MNELCFVKSDLGAARDFNARLRERFPERNWKSDKDLVGTSEAATLVYLARDADTDVGLAIGEPKTVSDMVCFELGLMHTDPDCLRQGVGSGLITHLQSNWTRIVLTAELYGEMPGESRVELTQKLFGFYERRNFVREPNRNRFYWPRSEFREILERD